MSNKILVSLLATFAFMASAAADHHEGAEGGEQTMEKKPFAIYGDFAGSYTLQGNEHSAAAGVGAGNNPASPNQHDSFAVDNAFVNIEKNWSRSKLHLQVGYGTYQGNLSPASGNTLNLLNAYYAHNCGSGFGFLFGKYDSPMGYESYRIMDNRQYTRSWGFTQHNYFQTGLGLTYDFSGMANVGFHVTNGTQNSATETDNNRNKSMTLAIGITAVENLAIDLKYQTGVDTLGAAVGTTAAGNYDSTLTEVTAAYKVSDSFDFAIDYLSRTAQLKLAGSTEGESTSIAAYLNGNFGLVGASLRYEQFEYDYGMLGTNFAAQLPIATGPTPGTDNSVSSITASVHYDIDQNARTILEYRTDSADDGGTFLGKDGIAAEDSADTITLGLMYRF